MADDKQKQIDDLYAKYQKTLELLNDALDQLAFVCHQPCYAPFTLL